MKKALLFVALIAAISSCKKDNSSSLSLNGTWKLNTITGGFGPTVVIPDSEKEIYKITNNSIYVRTDAKKVETRGYYKVTFIEESNGYRFGSIIFSNPQKTEAFAFKADTMIIGSSAADGPSYKFVRIKR